MTPPARPRRPPPAAAAPEVAPPLELDTVSSHWQLALDGAQRALVAAGGSLLGPELERRRRALGEEREQTAQLLVKLAHVAGVHPLPWLSPSPLSPAMLGLPANTAACLFDLDGVLTDSAVLHARAWAEVFDEFLLRLAEKTGMHFIPFDRDADYREFVDGRPRLEGVHVFLNSRGIRLSDEQADDLARRKGEALARGLHQRGVTALDGARRYLEAAGHAGLARAVVSASTTTLPMLELAGLATLVEARADAEVMRAEGLRSRPSPDLLLFACRRLNVEPEAAVTFTHSAVGVAAGHAAGLTVIGVGEHVKADDAHVVSLREQLAPQLSVG